MALGLALAACGCASEIDMARTRDAGRAATTIPYAGVRGARTFADYESINRSILTGADPFEAPKPGAKGKPKGGSK